MNDKVIAQKPFVFERTEATVTELPVSAEDEDVYAKYLILYSIAVNNGYDCQKVSSFDYSYEVVRKNVSVWDGTGGVTVTSVTYDWAPNE